MSPPIIVQNRRLIARPRPVPPYLRVVDASTWVNSWNSLSSVPASCRCPCRRPGTESSPCRWRWSRDTSRRTGPFSVNLQALLSRLNSTCRTLVMSARMKPSRRGAIHRQRVAVSSRRAAGWSSITSPHERRDLEGLDEELHLAGLDLRKVENVVDQRLQVLAGRMDLLRGPAMESCLAQIVGLLLQHLAVADDGVQRGPQLVAHVREELALGAVGRFRRVLRLEQFFLRRACGR